MKEGNKGENEETEEKDMTYRKQIANGRSSFLPLINLMPTRDLFQFTRYKQVEYKSVRKISYTNNYKKNAEKTMIILEKRD